MHNATHSTLLQFWQMWCILSAVGCLPACLAPQPQQPQGGGLLSSEASKKSHATPRFRLIYWFLLWYLCIADISLSKVNSVQEACAKCFAVHILKFEILQITWKRWIKEHKTLSFQFFINRSSILMFFCFVFHVVCMISNFNMWTAKHFAKVEDKLFLCQRRR